MDLLSGARRIHLIGVCGTAMASLAGMLKERGYEVRGSDQNVYPPMSTELEKLGIRLSAGYGESNLDWEPDLVVIGNALSRGNPEVERVLDEGLHYCSMPEVVKELFIRGHRCIVVAGTHGKTTTTSLLAWLFECAGLSPNFLVGGIAQNFEKSYHLGGGNEFIIEGDEYDTAFFDKGPKFLHYLPHTVLLNNIEYDHADIYPNLEAVRLSFQRLVNIIPRRGALIANWDDGVVREVAKGAFCRVVPFGLWRESLEARSPASAEQWVARAGAVDSTGTPFTVIRAEEEIGSFKIPLFGDFNVSNALGAVATALQFGVSVAVVDQALQSFQSVRRRMEIRGQIDGITVIDDFAHHPTAIRQTLKGVRARFPKARIWAIVEPRSATMRRSVFEGELAEAFDGAERIVFADLFSPDKIPVEQRLSPENVVKTLGRRGKWAQFIPRADDIVRQCVPLVRSGDVFVVFSNGGFDNIHEKLMAALRKGNAAA